MSIPAAAIGRPTPRRWSHLALAACLMLGVAVGTPDHAQAQDPVTTDVSVTVHLDDGATEATEAAAGGIDETDGAAEDSVEGTGVETVTAERQSGVETETVAEENRRLVAIVGGLIAVALALLLMTIRYWRITKPVPTNRTFDDDDSYLDVDDDLDSDDQPEDEFIDDLDDDDLFVPARSSARAAAAGARTAPARRSRRAVAGADHDGADDDWEPRATGEQDSVEAPSTLSRARPSRTTRQRALDPSGD